MVPDLVGDGSLLFYKKSNEHPRPRQLHRGIHRGLRTNDEYCGSVAYRGIVYNFTPSNLPENQCEKSGDAQRAVNGTAIYSLYCRPGMLCNSDRIDEARPIAREHRSQGLRSFSRQSQVFPLHFSGSYRLLLRLIRFNINNGGIIRFKYSFLKRKEVM